MIYPISKGLSLAYAGAIKPLLFRFEADSVHETMISSGHRLQKLAPVRGAMRLTMRYDHPALVTNVAGISYRNPIGLSAGMDKDAKIVQLAEAVGFGFIECGSVTLRPYGGNPKPWYSRLPRTKSIVVNSGLRSEGAETVIDRSLRYPDSLLSRFPLNISVAKTNSPHTCTLEEGIDDYVGTLRAWEKRGNARLYTINISCPNTYGGEPYTSPKRLDALLGAIDALHIKKPIYIKMPIDKSWHEFEKLLYVCTKHNVQGITLGNLYKDRQKLPKDVLKDPLPDTIKGNLSGRPCWEPSNDLLARSYSEYGDRFVFSGVGGVFSAHDAYTKIRLGASIVELITGMIFQGPMLIGQINRELVQLLQKDGFEHVSQAVGVDVKRRGA